MVINEWGTGEEGFVAFVSDLYLKLHVVSPVFQIYIFLLHELLKDFFYWAR